MSELKNESMRVIFVIVGMPGSGKTEASEFLVKKDFQFIRLGQLTLNKIKKRGLKPTEANERPIREELRKKHGMAAFATLNFPKIDTMLKNGDVVVDGMYSWEEYLAFKEKYPNITVIAIYAPPKTRYERLEKQSVSRDSNIKRRHYTKEEATSRDRAQLENLHTGGPIAMADFTIVNEATVKELQKCLEEILKNVKK